MTKNALAAALLGAATLAAPQGALADRENCTAGIAVPAPLAEQFTRNVMRHHGLVPLAIKGQPDTCSGVDISTWDIYQSDTVPVRVRYGEEGYYTMVGDPEKSGAVYMIKGSLDPDRGFLLDSEWRYSAQRGWDGPTAEGNLLYGGIKSSGDYDTDIQAMVAEQSYAQALRDAHQLSGPSEEYKNDHPGVRPGLKPPAP